MRPVALALAIGVVLEQREGRDTVGLLDASHGEPSDTLPRLIPHDRFAGGHDLWRRVFGMGVIDVESSTVGQYRVSDRTAFRKMQGRGIVEVERNFVTDRDLEIRVDAWNVRIVRFMGELSRVCGSALNFKPTRVTQRGFVAVVPANTALR